MGSSGVHSNGYSLVRHVLATAELDLASTPDELGGRTLGDELLTPTRIYSRDCLALISALIESRGVHALSHITGGGLAGNLVRVLPDNVDAVVDRSTWSPLPIFQLLARTGGIPRADLEPAFNLGVGMIAVVAADHADAALSLLAGRDVPAWQLGKITEGTGQVQLQGNYADCAF
jgi:phosphoribosylformylglycinamidine cyclo-ligase